MKHCVGCVCYEIKGALQFCNLDGAKMKFPGKGCGFFVAREPRYERYNDADYQEYVKECKMCEQS